MVDVKTLIHVTPTPEELLYNSLLQCHVAGCNSIFKNGGHLYMHLERRHKLPPNRPKDNGDKRYFCPKPECRHHELSQAKNRKPFKTFKYLRMHFLKMHTEKRFKCGKCTKLFGTCAIRNYHERTCGREYICGQCGSCYDSACALIMHAKRKNHKIKVEPPVVNGKVAIPRLKQPDTFKSPKPVSTVLPRRERPETIAIPIPLPLKKRMKVVMRPDTPVTPYCDIETQTEMDFNSGVCDPMLYSNMHTQTCDLFLTELGLSDIQTQTNWPAMDEQEPMQNNRSEKYSSGAHDELMVSTETQTSFTQCLLDSCNENSLSGCITQHTQTCEELLDKLFEDEDNDFIGSFQSTHTQT